MTTQAPPKKERRRHRRFPAVPGAFAAVSPNSFKIGQIVDISRGGLMFIYPETTAPSDPAPEQSLFLSSTTAHVDKMPFNVVADDAIPHSPQALSHRMSTPGSASFRQRRIAFGELNLEQMTRLDHFIACNALVEQA